MTKLWLVRSEDGLQGTLHKKPGKSQTVNIRLDDGRAVSVPTAKLVLQADGSYFLPIKLGDLAHQAQPGQQQEQITLSLAEERLDIEKRLKVTGHVRIDKIVHEHEQTVDEPLIHEQVEVEHVAVNRVLERPAEIRHEGETLVLPIMEEVLVVETRLMLKEEVRITVRRTVVNEPQRVVLKQEDIVVQRLDPKEQNAD